MVEASRERGGDPADVLRPGAATAIGSLPHPDPVAAAELVLERLPDLPAAPTLPARDPRESMLGQATWGLRGLRVRESRELVVDEGFDPGATPPPFDLDAPPWTGVRTFLEVARGRTDPVKLQVTGPVTVGRALHAAGVEAPIAFDLAGRVARSQARGLVEAARHHLGPVPLVVFVDEPGLAGSAHPRFPLAADRVIDLVSGVLAAVEEDAVTGLHCCGAADWALALAAGPDVLSAPLDTGLAFVPELLAGFLDRGGWVAWGAVPTDEPVGTTGERLLRRLLDLWCGLVRGGCEALRLRERALLTPACGLALHGESQAERALDLTGDVADRVGRQAVLARLSVGA